MKTILVPVDFSETSINAAKYACELAKKLEANIILFHAYHVPVVVGEAPAFIPPLDEVEKTSLKNLQRLKEDLMFQNERLVSVLCICKCGFAVDEIKLYAKEHRVDFIVMGTQGVGYLAERLLGSTTSALIHNTKSPIIAIDKNARYSEMKKIVFACEYAEERNPKLLQPLKLLAHTFGGHVYVINIDVEKSGNTCNSEVPGDCLNLGDSLSDIDHSYHYRQASDVVSGINAFAVENNADLICILPQKHALLNRILHEPVTKQMVFHSKAPLLILH
ncbi:MAG TPA: universal stress protein [Bacteroidia bacterium]